MILHIVVVITGLVYLYMDFFVAPADPFAVVNHPAQPNLLVVHIVAAPVLVVFFGMILRSHSLPKIRRGELFNRYSGWFGLASFGVMAMSGYLLQVAVAEFMRDIWYWLHIVTGLLFVVVYTFHFVRGWPLGRARRRRST